ncbi:unnamed protein product, partial [Trichobilharzia szidati]
MLRWQAPPSSSSSASSSISSQTTSPSGSSLSFASSSSRSTRPTLRVWTPNEDVFLTAAASQLDDPSLSNAQLHCALADLFTDRSTEAIRRRLGRLGWRRFSVSTPPIIQVERLPHIPNAANPSIDASSDVPSHNDVLPIDDSSESSLSSDSTNNSASPASNDVHQPVPAS